MMIRWYRFNIYLALFLAACFALGCKTEEGKRKKQLAIIQLLVEMNPDPMGRTQEIKVYREHPVTFTVSRAPFLSEANLKQAQVVEVVGGFALRLDFDHEGGWLLEQYTSGNRGKHIAVFGQWDEQPDAKLNPGRWLAAPLIQNHIADGVFIFTPDATRQEIDNLVLGLNNVAKKLGTGKEVKW